MKKEYLKPSVECVSLVSEEANMYSGGEISGGDDYVVGSMGTTSNPFG